MLVFNTTYSVPNGDARNFVIWIHQAYLPKVAEGGLLTRPRLLRVLNHNDEETECFSLQFDVESSATLHKWYSAQGQELQQEMQKMFNGQVVGFSTLMEIIDGE